MNAKAWRCVWEKWKELFPTQSIESPCLLDYFIYNVIGKQFCKPILHIFECQRYKHLFRWHSKRNQTCQFCYPNERNAAICIKSILPCQDEEGKIAIENTNYIKSLPEKEKFENCPFKNICKKPNLDPPNSISIFGKTGWTTAYSITGNGGGGLKA